MAAARPSCLLAAARGSYLRPILSAPSCSRGLASSSHLAQDTASDELRARRVCASARARAEVAGVWQRQWSASWATPSAQALRSAFARSAVIRRGIHGTSRRSAASPQASGDSQAAEVKLVRRPAEPEEPEVDKAGEPTIVLTQRAQEKLRSVSEAEQNPKLALRIAVEPGGCHGYQYKMELTDEAENDDFHFQAMEGVTLYVDSISLHLIKGSTIDYVTELIGSQFAIKDNPQAKGAGCGCGVSWEPAI